MYLWFTDYTDTDTGGAAWRYHWQRVILFCGFVGEGDVIKHSERAFYVGVSSTEEVCPP